MVAAPICGPLELMPEAMPRPTGAKASNHLGRLHSGEPKRFIPKNSRDPVNLKFLTYQIFL